MVHPTFGDVLRTYAAGPKAHDVALRYGAEVLNWRELDARSDERAARLIDEGVVANDLVAISLPNGCMHHVWAFAAWKAGATPCVLPTRLPETELHQLVTIAAPRVLVRQTAGEMFGVPGIDEDAFVGDPSARVPAGLAADHWRAIATGGSTGTPKLIVHHDPARMTERLAALTQFSQIPVAGVMLNAAPSYHAAGFLFPSLALLAGTTVVGMERFDPTEWLRLVEQHRVEWAFLVPTMMHRIWSLPEAVRASFDLSSLRMVVHMAAACPIWLKRAWIDWLGPARIVEAYAGTETPGTTITGEEWLRKPGSVGRIGPGSITIRRADGEPCAPGEVGEIYFPPAATDTFHYIGAQMRLDGDGRLSLGDLGYVDEEGYLYLADRRTDLIIRGGANIYPAEVESVLLQHSAIADAVVIGLPCDEFGQRVHAILEPAADKAVDIADVTAFARSRLASYKCPETFEIATGPIKDEAGKAPRGALRDERIRWQTDGIAFALPAASRDQRR